MPRKETKLIAKNRKALHDYEILESFEAGIELTGTEVCALRESNCQLTDAFALIRHGEVWLHNLHIHPYSHGNLMNPDPDRRLSPAAAQEADTPPWSAEDQGEGPGAGAAETVFQPGQP